MEDLTIHEAVYAIIQQIGEDPQRAGLADTPERVERMYREICGGYTQDLDSIVHGAVFDEPTGGTILVRDISFYSLCEHHMLPFFGMVHVAYIPDGKIIGLSKIPRIVEMYSKRLQIQERLTEEIAQAMITVLNPKGIAVLIEGHHMCAMMRGVRKEQAELETSSFHGIFESDPELRKEFLTAIHHNPDTETNL